MVFVSDELTIPESVISYIAESVNESVRELEGIVNSLLAQSILFKREIDLDLAQRIVRKAVKCAESKPMTVSDIIAKVCEHYKIDETAIHTKTRKREVVQVRQERRRGRMPLQTASGGRGTPESAGS